MSTKGNILKDLRTEAHKALSCEPPGVLILDSCPTLNEDERKIDKNPVSLTTISGLIGH
jgi:hypothetical protein